MKNKISFSQPDITNKEIELVVDVLKSGWITSGSKVQEFEEKLQYYCDAEKVVLVNSATAAMELILKVFNIGENDEVITTPYTYTATSSVLIHRKIKPVYVDVEKDTFFIDYEKIKEAITEKTKAIIPVDFAGLPCDYNKLKKILKDKRREDVFIIVDSAHSFGAKYEGKIVGTQCDFHTFSFHAVKNLTTAEGGAIIYNNNLKFENFENNDLYKTFKITSLHGQTKDAFSKMKGGNWEYDVITDGFKCNMTDISAAIGVAQLEKYEKILEKRKKICNMYEELLKNKSWTISPNLKLQNGTESSYHLYPLRIKGFDENKRNDLISYLSKQGIATNVHFKPLPMLTLYKNLGYDIKDFPNSYNQYKNEISLPVHTKLDLNDIGYIIKNLIDYVENNIK